MKVLFVEDHPAMVEGYKSIFSKTQIGEDWQFDHAYSLQAAHQRIMQPGRAYDLICLDIEMSAFKEENLYSGHDLANLIRKQIQGVKLVIITSHMESSIVYPLIKSIKPEGYILKSDVYPSQIVVAIDSIMNGHVFYSDSIRVILASFTKQTHFLDANNRQIILLLNQGIKTKNIPQHMNLSLSAVDKRKSLIKEYFGIQKGTDEDILREARKSGFIS